MVFFFGSMTERMKDIIDCIFRPQPVLTIKIQVMRQVVAGLATTLSDLLAFQFLVCLGVNPYVTNLLTFCFAVAINFTLTRFYVFGNCSRYHIVWDFSFYFVSCLVSLVISELCLFIFIGSFNFAPLVAKVLSIPIIFVYTCLSSKFIFNGFLKNWSLDMLFKRRDEVKIRSLDKNFTYFLDNNNNYSEYVNDMLKSSHDYISRELDRADHLLDIGNGGVFNYDTDRVKKITALDLFLTKLKNCNKNNIEFIDGDALNLPFDNDKFESCLLNMVIHHLIGASVNENFINMRKAISEAYRVLIPGGKLIIVESVVPLWFNIIEKIVYRQSSRIIRKFLTHPPTFQYTLDCITQAVSDEFKTKPKIESIPLGKYVMQFGFKVPTFLTPVREVIIVAKKSVQSKFS